MLYVGAAPVAADSVKVTVTPVHFPELGARSPSKVGCILLSTTQTAYDLFVRGPGV